MYVSLSTGAFESISLLLLLSGFSDCLSLPSVCLLPLLLLVRHWKTTETKLKYCAEQWNSLKRSKQRLNNDMGADCNGKWKMKDEDGDGNGKW